MIQNATELLLGPNALPVLENRYLARDDTGQVVETPEQLFQRVAEAIAEVEAACGASQEEVSKVAESYYMMMTSGRFMPNSPTLMNAGRRLGMLSACFVLPLEDSIEDIMQTATDIALVQKAGGGTGVDLSALRPRGSIVASSGGTTDGPLSFLQMLSSVTTAIQQGAFRRGANMAVMRIDHPDILQFVDLKSDLEQVTNYNLSVAVTDEFMHRLANCPDEPHWLWDPHTNRDGVLVAATGQARYAENGHGGLLTVRGLWKHIAKRAWETGEPGLIFIDEINRHNTTQHLGPMCAVNPCGEQPLHANEACNLGSINLAAFYDEQTGEVDLAALEDAVRLAVRFLDDVVQANNYPTERIREACLGNRRIGLGVMGFADLLYQLGIPYDSEKAILTGEHLASLIDEAGHAASEQLAELRGEFPNWPESTWDTLHNRKMRNAQVTTIAPTGTISIIAGCSGGIEPLFSLRYVRQVLNGQTLEELNPVFEAKLRERIHDRSVIENILRHAGEHGTIRDCSLVPNDLQEVFCTARDVSPKWHLRMQSAWQKHTDAAVSKTINLPADATVDDVKQAYDLACELKLKGITVYRDGSRSNQPMALKADGISQPSENIVPVDLPELMPSVRIKQRSPLGNLHAQISVDPVTGVEREVFAQLGKAGELACADLEAICRLMSYLLRCGVSLQPIVDQLHGIGSSLSLPSRDGRVMSLPDALAHALGKYIRAKEAHGIRDLLLGTATLEQPLANANGHAQTNAGYKLKCPDCDGELAFEEACAKCHACGFSQC